MSLCTKWEEMGLEVRTEVWPAGPALRHAGTGLLGAAGHQAERAGRDEAAEQATRLTRHTQGCGGHWTTE